jgi:hypothetical protein
MSNTTDNEEKRIAMVRVMGEEVEYPLDDLYKQTVMELLMRACSLHKTLTKQRILGPLEVPDALLSCRDSGGEPGRAETSSLIIAVGLGKIVIGADKCSIVTVTGYLIVGGYNGGMGKYMLALSKASEACKRW